MSGLLEIVTLLTSLTQLASRLMAEANALAGMIDKAKAEGRDLTDEELAVARDMAVKALARLA